MPHPRVLIVDDDPVVLKFVQANLQAMDCETLTAMDGFEVCRQVREWSQIPIIMLSARGDVSDKVKGLNLGADDYIAKPFGVNELMARVRAVLRRTEDKAGG